MKNLFAFAAVAGMVALASCGGAENAAKHMQDSMMKADSMAAVQRVADSSRMADSITKAEADKVAAAAAQKHWSDSMHDDSVAKKLIKVKK
jgi:hypothetical protein